MQLLIDPLCDLQLIIEAYKAIYVGAPVKQLKRKAKPSAESTMKGTSCCVIRRNC